MKTFRKAYILCDGKDAGLLEETAEGFRFTYGAAYLRDGAAAPVSLTLPKRSAAYAAPHLFPCFHALLAEGALAQEQCRRLRLDERDYLGRLLATPDAERVGNLQVKPATEETP